MNLIKLFTFTLLVIFSFTIVFVGCGKMTDKDRVMVVQKELIDFIKSNDYKAMVTYNITDEMANDNAKLQEYMQSVGEKVAVKMNEKQAEAFKKAGFANEEEFQKIYDKVKTEPEVAALDKELGTTVETVSTEINNANQKMLMEKTKKVPDDGTQEPTEKK
jgi:hypothetical protein